MSGYSSDPSLCLTTATSPNVTPGDGDGRRGGTGMSSSSRGTSSRILRMCSSSFASLIVGSILPISIFWITVTFSFALKARSCCERPSFALASLTADGYSSIRSDSSTAFGSFSIGACVCDGAITGRAGLSGKLGSRVPSFPDRPARPVIAPSHTHAPIEKLPKAVEESDLIEEYPSAVKEARAKLGLSQQDLAFKAKEKVTVIQKIEVGKMLPTMRLAKELEHILRIRLLVPRDELDIPV